MSTTSAKMDLFLPSTTDLFKTSDVQGNWAKIDAAPGTFICTSTSRPSWDATKAGRRILETDTNLGWVWSGSVWQRIAPVGLLNTSGGSKAYAERSTALSASNTQTTPVTCIAVTNVVVPAGNRPLRIEIKSSGVQSASFVNSVYGSICQQAGYGPPFLSAVLMSVVGASPGNNGLKQGGTYSAEIPDGLAAGTYDFSFQVSSTNNSAMILILGSSSGSGYAASISVTEL